MADEISLNISGISETIGNIKQLYIASPTAVLNGVKDTAGKIERQAKLNLEAHLYSPATDEHTGRLKASISHNWTNSGMEFGAVGSKAPASDGVRQPKKVKDRLSAIIGSNTIYARRHELGFMDKDKLGRRFNQSPRPWLYPAFFALEGELYTAITYYLAKELKAAMARGKAMLGKSGGKKK